MAGGCGETQGEERGGEKRRQDREKGEAAHPRLGVHPSLESVCAVITVSNRWDGAWEEGAHVCTCMRVCLRVCIRD